MLDTGHHHVYRGTRTLRVDETNRTSRRGETISTVNATMMWYGDANQASPLPTGTLTVTVYDPGCPSTGCIYTHTITSSDYQWAPAAGGWSIHYAFSLGTEYSPADTFWLSYSGDNTFAGSSAQARNT